MREAAKKLFFLVDSPLRGGWGKELSDKEKNTYYIYIFFCIGSVRVFCAQNSQREGRDHLFHWDMGISVGFSIETTGPLRNPETRRNPSILTLQLAVLLVIGVYQQRLHLLNDSNVEKT